MSINLANIPAEDRITSIAQLESHYKAPMGPAITKEIDYISEHYRVFIEKSPFVVVATSGPEGLDCSPRGDPSGFMEILDEKTVIFADRRGNNRLDSLRNIVADPRIALLFLIPGIDATLRINGRAEIVTNAELCASMAMAGKTPASVVVVHVERIYTQCPKALVRSNLWSAEAQIPKSEMPTSGAILKALSKEDFDGEAYDRNYPEHLQRTIY